MFLELTVTSVVAGYIVMVAVVDVLLVAAILRFLRVDGQPQRAAAGWVTPDGEMKPLPVRPSPKWDLAEHEGVDIERRQAPASRENAPLNFAEQRQVLSGDLRYVATITCSQC